MNARQRIAPRRRVLTATRRDHGDTITQQLEAVTTDAEVDARMLAASLAPSHARALAYFKRFGDVDNATARRNVEDEQVRLAAEARATPAQEMTWDKLAALAETDLEAALSSWLRVRDYAADELESGARAALVSDRTPLDRARYLALRGGFIEQWKPEGEIEVALVDMLAQTYNLFLYWSLISHSYSAGLCVNAEEMWRHKGMPKWELPYDLTRDAVAEAHTMTEQYHRRFLRTLEQLRAMRAYTSSVIVNNGGQVNIGNHQINAQTQSGD